MLANRMKGISAKEKEAMTAVSLYMRAFFPRIWTRDSVRKQGRNIHRQVWRDTHLVSVEHVSFYLKNSKNSVERVDSQKEECDVDTSDPRVHIGLVCGNSLRGIDTSEKESHNRRDHYTNGVVAARVEKRSYS
jgi:hypothetical protein